MKPTKQTECECGWIGSSKSYYKHKLSRGHKINLGEILCNCGEKLTGSTKSCKKCNEEKERECKRKYMKKMRKDPKFKLKEIQYQIEYCKKHGMTEEELNLRIYHPKNFE